MPFVYLHLVGVLSKCLPALSLPTLFLNLGCSFQKYQSWFVIVTVVPDACTENHLCSGSVFLDICSNVSMFRFPLNIISQTVQSFTPIFAEIKMLHGLVICHLQTAKLLWIKSSENSFSIIQVGF